MAYPFSLTLSSENKSKNEVTGFDEKVQAAKSGAYYTKALASSATWDSNTEP